MKFEIVKCESSNFVVFQNCFGGSGPLNFHMNFTVCSSVSVGLVKGEDWDSDRIPLNWYVSLGSAVI